MSIKNNNILYCESCEESIIVSEYYEHLISLKHRIPNSIIRKYKTIPSNVIMKKFIKYNEKKEDFSRIPSLKLMSIITIIDYHISMEDVSPTVLKQFHFVANCKTLNEKTLEYRNYPEPIWIPSGDIHQNHKILKYLEFIRIDDQQSKEVIRAKLRRHEDDLCIATKVSKIRSNFTEK